MGPPNVYSYVGTTWLNFTSPGYGESAATVAVGTVCVRSPGIDAPAGSDVSARQLSLARESRKDPPKRFPPDLVTTLMTPPLKRPYSAEIPAVATVVSW